MWKTEKSLKYIWKSEKNPVIPITGITERLKRDEAQIVFEEIVAGKRYQTTHSEVPKTLNKINI